MTIEISKHETPGMAICGIVFIQLYGHLEKYMVDPRRNLTGIDPKTNELYPSWLRDAAKAAWTKLDKYYPYTDGMVYVVGTGNPLQSN